MNVKEYLENRIRGWLPKTQSLPRSQRTKIVHNKLIGRLIGLIGVVFFTVLLAFALPHWYAAGDAWPIYGLLVFMLIGLLVVFLVWRRRKGLSRDLQRTEVSTSFGIAVGFLAGALIGVLAVIMKVLVEGANLPLWGWPFLILLVGILIFAISAFVLRLMKRSLGRL
jgi:cation transport ATPase